MTNNSTDTPRAEWRELGQDEVICEGDEARDKYGSWISSSCIGMTPNRAGQELAFRTLRPLPMSNETDTPRTEVCPPLKS